MPPAGRPVVDFALRRTHGTDAGMKVARASYLAGFAGTSNVMAGQRLWHSDRRHHGALVRVELRARDRRLSRLCRQLSAATRSCSSIPTTRLQARAMPCRWLKKWPRAGRNCSACASTAAIWRNWRARCSKIFDEADLTELKIIGSGGLDEYDLAEFSAANVPFDSYGVGTKMGMSADAPWTDMSYKLVEYQNRPVLKLSTGKVSLPGQKAGVSAARWHGRFAHATLSACATSRFGGERLLKEVMRGGKIKRDPRHLWRRAEKFSPPNSPHYRRRVKSIRKPQSVSSRILSAEAQRLCASRGNGKDTYAKMIGWSTSELEFHHRGAPGKAGAEGIEAARYRRA